MTTKPRRQRIKNRAKARNSPEEEGVQSDKLDKVKNWHNVREEILSVLKRKQKIEATASSAIHVRFFFNVHHVPRSALMCTEMTFTQR